MRFHFPPRSTLLALAALIAMAPAPAQESTSTSQGFVLDAGDYAISNLLERASKFLGRNYFWSPNETDTEANRITIQKKLNLDVRGCEEVLSQLLYMKGFVVLPIDSLRGIYEVVSTRGQRVQEIAIHAVFMTPEEVLRNAKKKIQVLTTVPLQHLDAARAAQQMRPFFTSGGGRNGIQFGSPGNQQSVLLQGFAPQVAAAIRLLRVVDTPDQQRDLAPVRSRIQQLDQVAMQQANAIKALQSRVATLEKQLALLTGARKKVVKDAPRKGEKDQPTEAASAAGAPRR